MRDDCILNRFDESREAGDKMWEYHMVDFQLDTHPVGIGAMQNYLFISYIDPQKIGFQEDQKIQSMTSVLDAMGRAGWELVNIIPYNGPHDGTQYFKAVFKRPIDL